MRLERPISTPVTALRIAYKAMYSCVFLLKRDQRKKRRTNNASMSRNSHMILNSAVTSEFGEFNKYENFSDILIN